MSECCIHFPHCHCARYKGASPKPEAPTEMLAPVQMVSRDDLKKLYPEPPKDAGAPAIIRHTIGGKACELVPLEDYEKLERELASQNEYISLLTIKWSEERAKSAALVSALEAPPFGGLHNVKFYDADNEAICHKNCPACNAREALKKWSK